MKEPKPLTTGATTTSKTTTDDTDYSPTFLHFIKHLSIIYGSLFNHQFKGKATVEYAMRVYSRQLGDMEPEEAGKILDYLMNQREDKYPPNLKELVAIRKMYQPRKEHPLLVRHEDAVDPETAKNFLNQIRQRISGLPEDNQVHKEESGS